MALLERDLRPVVGPSVRRFSVDEHRRMREIGILGEGDELIDGIVYVKGLRRPWRWTCDDVLAMAEAGILTREERVELIDGEVVALTPIGDGHLATTGRLMEVLGLLRSAFGAEYRILQEAPIRIASDYWPQADIVVARLSFDELETRGMAPSDIPLVVEISFTSLASDRRSKFLAYAKVGIPEYWIINPKDRQVEVYRQPSGAGYAERLVFMSGDAIAPLFAPKVEIAVSDFLPVRS
ncbi:MAG: Uma2 family endonuclease [Capsulimonadaceae bacterium]